MTYPQRAVVVFSGDEHCGHPFALAHPDPWSGYNQEIHEPNELQLEIWRHWCECWQRVRELRRGARLIIVRMGDSVEGAHHETTQLDTQRRPEQEAIALRCWRHALELANFRHGHDHILGVIGSTAHVGTAGESDERVLRALLRADTDDGRLTVPRLRMSVNGVTIEAWHKGPKPGGRDWTRPNAILATLRDLAYRSAKRGQIPARYYCWAHFHEFMATILQADDGTCVSEGLICPAWKLKDEFVYTLRADALSNVGLLILSIDREGRSTWEAPRIPIEQDLVQEL